MNRTVKMLLFGNALGLVAAYAVGFSPAITHLWFRVAITSLVVAIAWRLFYRKPPVKDQQTRAWARAMYHNGFISIEELNQFYLTHPEDENGNGGN